MKVIKYGGSINDLRVVRKFAFIPKKMYLYATGKYQWVWNQHYFQLQRNSYWGYGWMYEEEGLNEHEWDFKWSEKYIAMWQYK